MGGAMAHHGGAAAEAQVARHYERAGFTLLARRWRGKHGGEIDLIVARAGLLVFVEVKQSASHAQAASHLTPAQIARIGRSAEEFAALDPRFADADMRFDAALVDGQGRIEILENAASFD